MASNSEPRHFTLAELQAAGPCVHSRHQTDCASCVYHAIWYAGRIDGLGEAAAQLAKNTAMVDAMREAVMEAERRHPPFFFNNRLIDRDASDEEAGPLAS